MTAHAAPDGVSATVDELRELRRRAYGPDADIAGDPPARRRLAELEAAERARDDRNVLEAARGHPTQPAVGVVSDRGGSDRVVADGAVAEREPGVSDGDEGDEDAEASAAAADETGGPAASVVERRRRALPWLVAAVASVIALIGLTGVIGATLSRPQPEETFAAVSDPPDGTPMPVVDRSWLAYWGVSDPVYRYHGEFGAMQLWSLSGGTERNCLLVTVEEQTWTVECAVPPIDPAITVVTDGYLVPPDAVTPAIPDGSTVRLSLTGDTVEVFVARLALVQAADPWPANRLLLR